MRLDELKQPLQRRSLMERLWQQRPSALATGFAVLFMSYAAGGTWLVRQKLSFAGEPIVTAQIAGVPVALLARHGEGHLLSPSSVPFRANIYALKLLGAKQVVSVSAVVAWSGGFL